MEDEYLGGPPPEELLPCPDRCPLLVTMAHIYFAARLSRFYQGNCRHLAREGLHQLPRRLCLPCTRGSSPQAATHVGVIRMT
jgi:hypothetical protein